MRRPSIRVICSLPGALAMSMYCGAAASAQEAVAVACVQGGQCSYQKAYSPTLNAQTSVKVMAFHPGAAASPGGIEQSGPLSALAGVYREPESGLLRVRNAGGELAGIVTPSKPSRTATAATPQAAWTIEYRDDPKSKTRVSVPAEQFVAWIRGPRAAGAVVEFLRTETTSPKPHPMQRQLIAAGIAFAEGSEELQGWRDQLRKTMRRSLDDFRAEAVDPTRLEALLAEGVAAVRIHQLVASDARQDEVLQQDLRKEYQRLVDRLAIARLLHSAGMDDAFLNKLNQIGLARWSRSDLGPRVEAAIQASAAAHYQRATELFKAGQYGSAFDEARLASVRARCNEEMNELYYNARVLFVNRNTIPSLPEYTKDDRGMLQQIVRDLQSAAQDAASSEERTNYVRRKISDGERLDSDYLPLQLEKAQFLANIGELTTSLDVVTNVERNVTLGRTDSDQWLKMDGKLNGDLVTLQQSTQRQLKEQIGAGLFKEALATATVGLRAEPTNPVFLYYGAAAAAVLRDDVQAKRLAQRYLRLIGPTCGLDKSSADTMLDLYRRQTADEGTQQVSGKAPNWISGQLYAPGETYYDPMSGSFNARIVSSNAMDGKVNSSTEFRWDGYLMTSIRTSTGPATGDRRVLLEVEPIYDSKRVYMTGIGPRANSAGQRRIMSLRYLNSPDFDPLLASKFTGTVSTRGWAGNPFFHPFLWNDIFLFDLKYDEHGRIKEAVPVPPDATHPMSSYSERLTFTWDGNSNRLLAIKGARYRRDMTYDKHGRIVEEKIVFAAGKGSIRYTYHGDSPEILRIECEDNFYDKIHRIVYLEPSAAR